MHEEAIYNMQKGFDYVCPTSLSQALKHLNTDKNDAMVISGGTDVMVQLRYKSISPKKLVNVKDLEELKFTEEKEDWVYIGGSITFSQIIKDNIIKNNFPSLVEAAQEVGSPQIRNMGTLAGNVQTASPAGDGLAALYALDATVELVSEKGSREINIRDFVVGPKKTTRRSNEIIKGFKIAKQHWDYNKFFKIGKRNALAISIVNGAIMLNMEEDETIKDARIVLGAVAPTPLRLIRAEDALIGNKITEEILERVKNIIQEDINPISDIRASKEYRRYISAVSCKNIITLAKGGVY